MMMKLNNLKRILLLSLGSVFIVVVDRIVISRLAKHERSIVRSTVTKNNKHRPSSADSLDTNSGKAKTIHHLSSADSLNTNSGKAKTIHHLSSADSLDTNSGKAKTIHHLSSADSLDTNSGKAKTIHHLSSADSSNTNSGKAETVHHLLSANSLNKTSEKVKMVQWNGSKWITLQHYCDDSYKFEKTTLLTSFGSTPMFIHNIKDDVYVSNSLKRSGMWDSSNVNAVVEQLKRDPSLGLLDLGAQLGTHTLVASLLGRNVVAVDPLQSNVLRLCKSLEAGKFTNNVTVVFNALSDNYRKISFVFSKGNIGGTRITSSGTELEEVKSDSADSLNTVLLDDLLPFIPFKKAVMKMDVESHEMQVVRRGAKLFKHMNITAILMEWLFHRNDQALELKSHMINLGYKPFIPHSKIKSPLIDKNHKLWPSDVMWLK